MSPEPRCGDTALAPRDVRFLRCRWLGSQADIHNAIGHHTRYRTFMAAGTAGEPPAQGWADEPAASWVDDDATYASPTIGANPELPAAPLAERTDVAVVVHDGVPHELDPVQVLTFGRSALCTICLDGTDRGISRLAGSVRHESGTWWLSNCSTKRVLTVVDDLGIRSLLVPGRRIALGGGSPWWWRDRFAATPSMSGPTYRWYR